MKLNQSEKEIISLYKSGAFYLKEICELTHSSMSRVYRVIKDYERNKKI